MNNNHQLQRVVVKFYLKDLRPYELKEEINKLIDANEWSEGFELGVKEGDLDRFEVNELIEVLGKSKRIDLLGAQKVAKLIEHAVYWGCEYDFICTEENTWLLGDGLQVLRIDNGITRWTTTRISYDGIRNLMLNNGIVTGQSFEPTVDEGIWHNFRIDYHTGEVLRGISIQ